tara:strand:- start:5088 stop:5537 length:450 start_codon:yes stop_codon:yes gene_type:complete
MKISKKIIYAIESVIDIAFYSGINPVQNYDIAKRQGIPKRYLEQTLQILVKNKILVGSRGPKGGYRLAKERRKIKISDIIRSVKADEVVSRGSYFHNSELSKKLIKPIFDEAFSTWINYLTKLSIDDICNQALKKGIIKQNKEKTDFVI